MVSSARLIPAQRCNWWKKRKDFAVYCPEKMWCFTFAPASEWKEDKEWIAHHTHSDVRKRAAQLVCDCSNELALRKSY